MAFSEEVVRQAWQRAGGKCECPRSTCRHSGRCGKQLIWSERGKETAGGWEAYHRVSIDKGGSDALSNCEILCQVCHKNTKSYGG